MFLVTFEHVDCSVLEIGQVYEHVVFAGFRVPQHCASVSQLPTALRCPPKSTPLDFLSMYLVDVVDLFLCLMILGSPKWPR